MLRASLKAPHFRRTSEVRLRSDAVSAASTEIDKEDASMAHTLPPLPYAPDALEPHIDKQTMEIHHGKHHQGLRDQPECRAGEASRSAVEERRGFASPHRDRAGRHPHGGAEQRRRPRQSLDVLADHGAARRRSRRPDTSPMRSTRRSAASTRSRSSLRRPASAGSAAAGRG